MENTKEESLSSRLDENAGGDNETIDTTNDGEANGCQATGSEMESTAKDSNEKKMKSDENVGDGVCDDEVQGTDHGGDSAMEKQQNEGKVEAEEKIDEEEKDGGEEKVEDVTDGEQKEQNEEVDESTGKEQKEEKAEEVTDEDRKGEEENDGTTDKEQNEERVEDVTDEDQKEQDEEIDGTAGKVQSEERVEDVTDEKQKGVEKVDDSSEPGEDSGKEKVDWMDILGNDLLKKKVVKSGNGIDSRPLSGQMVTVRCEGYLDNDNKVDEHSALQFILGDGDVITAFDLCVSLMEMGEVCTLITDARYAYGELGRKPDIPGNARLRYEMELLKIEDGPDIAVIDSTERLQLGNKKRERGNELYLRGDFSSAINSYTKALSILDAEEGGTSQDEYKDIEEAKLKCHNNLAACQLKVEAYDAALKSCDSVLNIEPDNVKALFRKAKVLACKGELEDAIADMRKAIKLEPSNKVIHQELSKLVTKHKEQMSSTKDMCRKMVGGMADMATKVKSSEQKSKKSSSMFPSSGILLGATVAAVGAVVTAVVLALR